MKPKFLCILSVLLIISFLLNACGESQINIATLISTCGDQRQGVCQLFGNDSFPEEVLVDRSVAGGAHVPPYGYVRNVEANNNVLIKNVFLIAHQGGDECLTCGGLAGIDALKNNTYHGPVELAEYLHDSVPSSDPFIGMQTAAQEYITQGIPNGVMGLADHLTGQIRIIGVWADGKITAAVSATDWQAYVNGDTPIPSLSDDAVPAWAKVFMEKNRAAIPTFTETANKLLYNSGQPMRELILSTRMDWTIALETDASFQITVQPGQELFAIRQMSYAFSHSHKLQTNLSIITNNNTELANIVTELDASPTFLGTTLGEVNAEIWPLTMKSSLPIMLRESGTGQLYAPVLFGNTDPVKVVPFNLPEKIDEASVTEALKTAGVSVEADAATNLAAVLPAYIGIPLKIIGIGATIFYTFYIITKTGDLVFGWGPAIQLSSYNQLDFASSDVQDYLADPPLDPFGGKAYYTGAEGIDILGAWSKIQQRIRTGQSPFFGVTLKDWSIPEIPGITDGMVQNITTPIIYYLSTIGNQNRIIVENILSGEKVIFIWGKDTDGWLNWIIDPNSPKILVYDIVVPMKDKVRCFMTITFNGLRYKSNFTPHCVWK